MYVACLIMNCVDGRMTSSENPSIQSSQQTWRKRHDSQLKTWFKIMKKNAELILDLRLYGFCCWNNKWLVLISLIASDCRVCSAFILYAINLLGWSRLNQTGMNAITHTHTHTLHILRKLQFLLRCLGILKDIRHKR